MNYLDTHNSIYLRYDKDPFDFKYRVVLICLQGFQRTHWQDAWQVENFFLINPNFCRHLFILLMNCVFFKLFKICIYIYIYIYIYIK
jgi:hypothetical protein